MRIPHEKLTFPKAAFSAVTLKCFKNSGSVLSPMLPQGTRRGWLPSKDLNGKADTGQYLTGSLSERFIISYVGYLIDSVYDRFWIW